MKAKKKKAVFKVEMELPDGLTKQQAKDYVLDAVRVMRGSYGPDDPVFGIDATTVRVVEYHKPNAGITYRVP